MTQPDHITEWRREFAERIGLCEWCRDPRAGIALHEISQGVDRQASQTLPACIVGLCAECHRLLHRMPDQRAAGLAILRLNRPEQYDLRKFWEVTDRQFPDPAAVSSWSRRFSIGERS